MAPAWSSRKRQAILILVYALIYPITYVVEGAVATIGMILTLPFLPIAWLGGMAMVGMTELESTYLIGAFISIFVQVWLVIAFNTSFRKKRAQNPADPL